MKISELENCPDWLREADTENANVEIIDGAVQWCSGTWNNGTWEGGTWENGTWLGGTWKSGGWWNGTWNDGTWNDGTWEGGLWVGGTWVGGSWESDNIQTIRFKYFPRLNGDKTITIGCKTKTREEWDKWFAGTEEYKTPRGTEAFQKIVFSYQQFIAYAETFNLIPKK